MSSGNTPNGDSSRMSMQRDESMIGIDFSALDIYHTQQQIQNRQNSQNFSQQLASPRSESRDNHSINSKSNTMNHNEHRNSLSSLPSVIYSDHNHNNDAIDDEDDLPSTLPSHSGTDSNDTNNNTSDKLPSGTISPRNMTKHDDFLTSGPQIGVEETLQDDSNDCQNEDISNTNATKGLATPHLTQQKQGQMSPGSALGTTNEKPSTNPSTIDPNNPNNPTTTTTPPPSDNLPEHFKDEADGLILEADLGKIFRYASPTDKLLIFIATIASMVNGAIMPAMAIMIGMFVQRVATTAGLLAAVTEIAYIFLVFGAIATVVGYICIALWITIAERQCQAIRHHFILALMRSEMAYHDQQTIGETMVKLVSNLEKIRMGIGQGFGQIIQSIFGFIVGLGIAFYYGWALALVILACVIPLLIFASVISGFSARKTTLEQQNAEHAGGIASQAFTSVHVVKALRLEDWMLYRYIAAQKDWLAVSITKGWIQGISMGGFMLIIFTMYGCGFYIGSIFIRDGKSAWPGKLYDGSVVLTIFYALVLSVTILAGMTNQLRALGTAKAAAFPLFETIDRSSPIDPFAEYGKHVHQQNFTGKVKFDLVTFQYPTRAALILLDLDLTFKPGYNAVIGPSGCGKSTVLQLISRYYDPDCGDVMIEVYDDDLVVGKKAKGGQNGSNGQDEDGEEDSPYCMNLTNSAKHQITQVPQERAEDLDPDALPLLVHRDYGLNDEKDAPNDDKGDKNAQNVIVVADTTTTLQVNNNGNTTAIQDTSPQLTTSAAPNKDNGQSVDTITQKDEKSETIRSKSHNRPTKWISISSLHVHSYRNLIAVCHQEPAVFAMSLKDNLLLGNPDATIDEMEKSLDYAGLLDFVKKLPLGLNQLVSSKVLSGGQQQRLCFARALLADKPILLLDEFCASLDISTTRIVHAGLDRWMAVPTRAGMTKTVISVTHKLSTIRHADCIFALNRGHVEQHGNHDELYAQEDGYYRRLLNEQAAFEQEQLEIQKHQEQLKLDFERFQLGLPPLSASGGAPVGDNNSNGASTPMPGYTGTSPVPNNNTRVSNTTFSPMVVNGYNSFSQYYQHHYNQQLNNTNENVILPSQMSNNGSNPLNNSVDNSNNNSQNDNNPTNNNNSNNNNQHNNAINGNNIIISPSRYVPRRNSLPGSTAPTEFYDAVEYMSIIPLSQHDSLISTATGRQSQTNYLLSLVSKQNSHNGSNNNHQIPIYSTHHGVMGYPYSPSNHGPPIPTRQSHFFTNGPSSQNNGQNQHFFTNNNTCNPNVPHALTRPGTSATLYDGNSQHSDMKDDEMSIGTMGTNNTNNTHNMPIVNSNQPLSQHQRQSSRGKFNLEASKTFDSSPTNNNQKIHRRSLFGTHTHSNTTSEQDGSINPAIVSNEADRMMLVAGVPQGGFDTGSAVYTDDTGSVVNSARQTKVQFNNIGSGSGQNDQNTLSTLQLDINQQSSQRGIVPQVRFANSNQGQYGEFGGNYPQFSQNLSYHGNYATFTPNLSNNGLTPEISFPVGSTPNVIHQNRRRDMMHPPILMATPVIATKQPRGTPHPNASNKMPIAIMTQDEVDLINNAYRNGFDANAYNKGQLSVILPDDTQTDGSSDNIVNNNNNNEMMVSRNNSHNADTNSSSGRLTLRESTYENNRQTLGNQNTANSSQNGPNNRVNTPGTPRLTLAPSSSTRQSVRLQNNTTNGNNFGPNNGSASNNNNLRTSYRQFNPEQHSPRLSPQPLQTHYSNGSNNGLSRQNAYSSDQATPRNSSGFANRNIFFPSLNSNHNDASGNMEVPTVERQSSLLQAKQPTQVQKTSSTFSSLFGMTTFTTSNQNSSIPSSDDVRSAYSISTKGNDGRASNHIVLPKYSHQLLVHDNPMQLQRQSSMRITMRGDGQSGLSQHHELRDSVYGIPDVLPEDYVMINGYNNNNPHQNVRNSGLVGNNIPRPSGIIIQQSRPSPIDQMFYGNQSFYQSFHQQHTAPFPPSGVGYNDTNPMSPSAQSSGIQTFQYPDRHYSNQNYYQNNNNNNGSGSDLRSNTTFYCSMQMVNTPGGSAIMTNTPAPIQEEPASNDPLHDDDKGINGVIVGLTDEEHKVKELEEKKKTKATSIILPVLKHLWPFISKYPFTLTIGLIACAIEACATPGYALLLKYVLDSFFLPADQMMTKTRLACVFFFCLGLGYFIFGTLRVGLLTKAGESITHDVRKLAFRVITFQELGSFFDLEQHSQAVLSTLLANDVEQLAIIIRDLSADLTLCCSMMIASIIMSYLEGWQLTTLMVGMTPFLVGCSIIQHFFLTRSSGSKELLENPTQEISECLTHIRVIATYRQEQFVLKRFMVAAQQYCKNESKRGHIAGVWTGLSYFAVFGCYALTFWFGGWLINRGQLSSMGLIQIFTAMQMSANTISQKLQQTATYTNALQHVVSIFNLINYEKPIMKVYFNSNEDDSANAALLRSLELRKSSTRRKSSQSGPNGFNPQIPDSNSNPVIIIEEDDEEQIEFNKRKNHQNQNISSNYAASTVAPKKFSKITEDEAGNDPIGRDSSSQSGHPWLPDAEHARNDDEDAREMKKRKKTDEKKAKVAQKEVEAAKKRAQKEDKRLKKQAKLAKELAESGANGVELGKVYKHLSNNYILGQLKISVLKINKDVMDLQAAEKKKIKEEREERIQRANNFKNNDKKIQDSNSNQSELTTTKFSAVEPTSKTNTIMLNNGLNNGNGLHNNPDTDVEMQSLNNPNNNGVMNNNSNILAITPDNSKSDKDKELEDEKGKKQYKIVSEDIKKRLQTQQDTLTKRLQSFTITFSSVFFAYPTRPQQLVFNSIDLTIPGGKYTCIVGTSGSGKSSILSLILRLYDPTPGHRNPFGLLPLPYQATGGTSMGPPSQHALRQSSLIPHLSMGPQRMIMQPGGSIMNGNQSIYYNPSIYHSMNVGQHQNGINNNAIRGNNHSNNNSGIGPSIGLNNSPYASQYNTSANNNDGTSDDGVIIPIRQGILNAGNISNTNPLIKRKDPTQTGANNNGITDGSSPQKQPTDDLVLMNGNNNSKNGQSLHNLAHNYDLNSYTQRRQTNTPSMSDLHSMMKTANDRNNNDKNDTRDNNTQNFHSLSPLSIARSNSEFESTIPKSPHALSSTGGFEPFVPTKQSESGGKSNKSNDKNRNEDNEDEYTNTLMKTESTVGPLITGNSLEPIDLEYLTLQYHSNNIGKTGENDGMVGSSMPPSPNASIENGSGFNEPVVLGGGDQHQQKPKNNNNRSINGSMLDGHQFMTVRSAHAPMPTLPNFNPPPPQSISPQQQNQTNYPNYAQNSSPHQLPVLGRVMSTVSHAQSAVVVKPIHSIPMIPILDYTTQLQPTGNYNELVQLQQECGSVMIDGVDIRTLTSSTLRGLIGFVSQFPVLYTGTIMDNLKCGNDEWISDDVVINACKMANIHNVIMSLPDQYKTMLGGAQSGLSGGQRARLSLARTLILNQPILLLDELHSNLDAESATAINQALERYVKGKTVIMIAHRLDLVANADHIVVLHGGKVVEQGHHDELIKQSDGWYKDLYQTSLQGH